MPKILPISKLGHPILRKKATPVSNIASPDIQNLIDDMLTTVGKVNGVGIAAPQIYVSKRIFIIASRPSKRYPKAPSVKPFELINPVILETSGQKIKDWEGCLSIPGLRGLVPRYPGVTVAFYNRHNKKQIITLEGFLARVFQHEHDHIEGTLFIDRIESIHDLYAEEEYQRIINI